MSDSGYMVAVIGAGPAGLFASRKLAEAGVRVVLFNRDVKPGGLAEYGIYHDKYKMKHGLRNQFKQILAMPGIEYFGNVRVCSGGVIVLEDILESGFHAALVTTGAQGTKWLRLPGENLPGVYHAKNIVYHYNLLPPFSQKKYLLGRHVAVVGAGNVMLDIAHYLVRDRKVEEVIAVVRRGPAEIKFTRKEMENVAANLNLPALDLEFDRVSGVMQAIGQDPDAVKCAFTDALPKALPRLSDTSLRFEFLSTPVRVMGDWINGVNGLKVEENTLVAHEGVVKARGSGNTRILPVDTVIFAIGDTVDKDFCVPTLNEAYVATSQPRFPVDGISFEAFNPDTNQVIPKIFLAGWARQASTGLVGYARKDGEQAAQAVLQFLQTQTTMPDIDNFLVKFGHRLVETHENVVTRDHLATLEAVEKVRMLNLGLEDFKFASNEEMFTAMGY
jgi:ferredoxin--NADP+ reductase